MSSQHSKEGGRTENFARNASLENLLVSLNAELWESEKKIVCSPNAEMSTPVILVMGPLRSGTTLFMQWLANTGLVAYPTNLLSRFYQAPIIGAKIQLLLTDPRFNFRDELGEFVRQSEYISENGKTKGVLAPNEFWYFWRRFLAEPSRDVWSDIELYETMDIHTLKAEMIGIMDVLSKPFAAKGMLFNYNIPFLYNSLKNVIFVHVHREPVDNISSVLAARERQLGSVKQWYSFKIPEYDELKELDAIHQAAGQVYYINQAVRRGLSSVPKTNKLDVPYEEFCQNPESFFITLKDRLARSGYDDSSPYVGEKHFRANGMDTKDNQYLAIESAYEYFLRKH